MVNIPSMQQLLEAGVHFGHRVSRGNPKMKPYIYGVRDGVHIIDLAKSEAKLQEASNFAHDLGKRGGVLLIVGTKKQAKATIEELAKEVGTHYLNERWMGGMLTNFEEIRKNIRKLNDLGVEKEKGELARYTKKEQLLIDRKLQKFQKNFGGVASMEKIPDAIFIVDTASDVTAVKEAIKVGVKTIGTADTNSDPSLLDYPIPANDDGIKAIKLIAETIIRAYATGKKDAGIVESTENAPQVSEDEKPPKSTGRKQKKEAGEEKLVEEIKEVVQDLEEKIEKQVLEESESKTA